MEVTSGFLPGMQVTGFFPVTWLIWLHSQSSLFLTLPTDAKSPPGASLASQLGASALGPFCFLASPRSARFARIPKL